MNISDTPAAPEGRGPSGPSLDHTGELSGGPAAAGLAGAGPVEGGPRTHAHTLVYVIIKISSTFKVKCINHNTT